MKSVVCTLFEGSYHFGVGALANSLFRQGFRGTIRAGYRGALPPWAQPLVHENGYAEYQATEGLRLRFVPVVTNRHLTNYKPEFLLQQWAADDADTLFYFDPDIVVRCGWEYFEHWVQEGVALCEDVNSPCPTTHPLRRQWVKIYERAGVTLNFTSDLYLNGGFIGVSARHRGFLETWKKIQEVMNMEVGNLAKTNLEVGGREHPFAKTDQDALNIAVGATDEPVSCVGKEGMDFVPGGFTMSHAIGPAKGWNAPVIRNAFAGYPPSQAIKAFLENAETPIRLYPSGLSRKKAAVRVAAFIGRFYRRA